MADPAGATKIMVIRHAEKPGEYYGQQYEGVDPTGSTCGSSGKDHLVPLGWQRAGGLVTLFAPPWGPKAPALARPQYLYASDPDDKSTDDSKDDGPSQRPYETVLPLAAALELTIDKSFAKKDFQKMVKDAVGKPGVVLIAWQHGDIPLGDVTKGYKMSHYILEETGTTDTFNIPTTWPANSNGVARYDLVFVFDRPSGSGPITAFTLYPQQLLAGDGSTA
ncbi:MAG TPA: hypothetical protein VHU83_08590 [Bryobacteraceae bacterium]|jgi:hypothetical protein|nr:hypothetical protein [Bryobacteraceae bacterium]